MVTEIEELVLGRAGRCCHWDSDPEYDFILQTGVRAELTLRRRYFFWRGCQRCPALVHSEWAFHLCTRFSIWWRVTEICENFFFLFLAFSSFSIALHQEILRSRPSGNKRLKRKKKMVILLLWFFAEYEQIRSVVFLEWWIPVTYCIFWSRWLLCVYLSWVCLLVCLLVCLIASSAPGHTQNLVCFFY